MKGNRLMWVMEEQIENKQRGRERWWPVCIKLLRVRKLADWPDVRWQAMKPSVTTATPNKSFSVVLSLRIRIYAMNAKHTADATEWTASICFHFSWRLMCVCVCVWSAVTHFPGPSQRKTKIEGKRQAERFLKSMIINIWFGWQSWLLIYFVTSSFLNLRERSRISGSMWTFWHVKQHLTFGVVFASSVTTWGKAKTGHWQQQYIYCPSIITGPIAHRPCDSLTFSIQI